MVEVLNEGESAAGERWRARYLGVLDAQERLEQDAGQRIAELSALVARLGRAMPESGSADFARRLEKLGDALKRRPLDHKLSQEVDRVHQGVLTVMEANERERDALNNALVSAVKRLEEAVSAKSVRRKLERFRASVERAKRASAPSELVTGLGELQATVLDGLTDAPAETRRGQACESAARPSDSRLPTHAREPNAVPAAAASPARAGAIGAVDRETVRQALADLASGVALPAALKPQFDAIVDGLSGEFGEAQLLDALVRIRDLFRAAFLAVREEYQGFLDSVDRRLDEALSALGDVVDGAQAAREMERDLSAGLDSSLAAMRSEAAAASNLDQLKTSIQSHLELLARSVRDFRDQGDALGRARDDRLEAMSRRLRELERESREARDQLEAQRALARIDELTGLANRRALEERLEQEIRAWRRDGTPFALAIADLDHFKRVNDRFGHAAGDRALKIFARIVTGRIRHTDFCARYGGEEFVLLFPGADATMASKVAEQVRGFVENCGFSYRGTPVPMTASFGVTQSVPGDDARSVLSRADQALYAAKDAGRNQVQER